MFRKERIWPTLSSGQPLRILTISLQEHATKSPPHHGIVSLKDIPETMPKVIEPTYKRFVEPSNYAFKGITRLTRG